MRVTNITFNVALNPEKRSPKDERESFQESLRKLTFGQRSTNPSPKKSPDKVSTERINTPVESQRGSMTGSYHMPASTHKLGKTRSKFQKRSPSSKRDEAESSKLEPSDHHSSLLDILLQDRKESRPQGSGAINGTVNGTVNLDLIAGYIDIPSKPPTYVLSSYSGEEQPHSQTIHVYPSNQP